jgi:GDP-D-mannose dehydratase
MSCLGWKPEVDFEGLVRMMVESAMLSGIAD